MDKPWIQVICSFTSIPFIKVILWLFSFEIHKKFHIWIIWTTFAAWIKYCLCRCYKNDQGSLDDVNFHLFYVSVTKKISCSCSHHGYQACNEFEMLSANERADDPAWRLWYKILYFIDIFTMLRENLQHTAPNRCWRKYTKTMSDTWVLLKAELEKQP